MVCRLVGVFELALCFAILFHVVYFESVPPALKTHVKQRAELVACGMFPTHTHEDRGPASIGAFFSVLLLLADTIADLLLLAALFFTTSLFAFNLRRPRPLEPRHSNISPSQERRGCRRASVPLEPDEPTDRGHPKQAMASKSLTQHQCDKISLKCDKDFYGETKWNSPTALGGQSFENHPGNGIEIDRNPWNPERGHLVN